jgi:hypothetical protein
MDPSSTSNKFKIECEVLIDFLNLCRPMGVRIEGTVVRAGLIGNEDLARN